MDERNQTLDPQDILRVILEQLTEMSPAQVIRSLRSIEERTQARTRAPSAIGLTNLGPGAMQVHGFGIQATTLKMDEEMDISPLPVNAPPHEEDVDGARNVASFVHVSHAVSVALTTGKDTDAHFQIDSRGVSSSRAGDVKLLLEVEQKNKDVQVYRIESNSVTKFAIDKDTTARLIGMGVSMNIENQASTSSQQQERQG